MSILLEKQKKIVILNPKCASRTLCEIFYGHMNDMSNLYYYSIINTFKHDHLSWNEFKNFTKIKNSEKYDLIISIRNPWQRMISLFHYFKYEYEIDQIDFKLKQFILKLRECSFEQMFSLAENDENFKKIFLKFNLDNMINGKFAHIIRTEFLQEDLKKIGFDFSEIPVLNKSNYTMPQNRTHRLKHLSNSPKESYNFSLNANCLIEEIFQSDIKAGNYKNPF